MTNQHLDPATIARIVDSGHGSASQEELRHLAGCRTCLTAFQDVAVLRGMDLSESSAQPDVAPARSLPAFRRAWIGAAAAAAFAVLAFMIFSSIDRATHPAVPDSVLARLVQQSETGFVVAEAATQDHLPSAPVRSGGGDAFGSSADSVETGDIRTTLLTMAATDRVDEARSLLETIPAERRDERWARHLGALLAYRSSRLDDAERGLRSLIADDENDGVARFNLALLLGETGRGDEARDLLDAMAPAPGTVLAHRTSELAAALPSTP